MKAITFLLFSIFITTTGIAQNIGGKWYGKITQKEGGYRETYDFELDLTHNKKNIRGVSKSLIPNELSVKIGLNGVVDGDSIRLKEFINDIREEILPIFWIACIKNINLKYYRQGRDEYLKGVWNGTSEEDGSPCLPGEVILSKNKQAVENFLLKDGFERPFFIETARAIPVFTANFKNTSVRKVTEINVKNREIELLINDYMNVDNDTVSIYFNREAIVNKLRISKKQTSLRVTLERISLNEIILFAENLGRIPPNTSQVLIIDGANTHRLIIESDKQKSAAFYLRYKP